MQFVPSLPQADDLSTNNAYGQGSKRHHQGRCEGDEGGESQGYGSNDTGYCRGNRRGLGHVIAYAPMHFLPGDIAPLILEAGFQNRDHARYRTTDQGGAEHL